MHHAGRGDGGSHRRSRSKKVLLLEAASKPGGTIADIRGARKALKSPLETRPVLRSGDATAPAWRPRDQPLSVHGTFIIDFIAENQIENVIFLTGDMHNSYHANMDIVRPDGETVAVHELMSSPINHFGKASRGDYLDPHEITTAIGQNKYKSVILPKTFFGDHSNLMTITVKANTVDWEIYRTRKDEPAEKSGQIVLS